MEIYWVELVLRKFRLKHPNGMILSGLSFSLILSLPLSFLLSPSSVCFSFVLLFRHTFPHIKARVHGQPDAGLSCFSVRVPWEVFSWLGLAHMAMLVQITVAWVRITWRLVEQCKACWTTVIFYCSYIKGGFGFSKELLSGHREKKWKEILHNNNSD